MKAFSITILVSSFLVALCSRRRTEKKNCGPFKKCGFNQDDDDEWSTSKWKPSSDKGFLSRGGYILGSNKKLCFSTGKKNRFDSDSSDDCDFFDNKSDSSSISDCSTSFDDSCPSSTCAPCNETPCDPCATLPCGKIIDPCNLNSICRPAETLCNEVTNQFKSFNVTLLTSIANYTDQYSNIIINNIGSLFNNPGMYLPTTYGASDLDELISQFGTDSCGISEAGKEKLKNLRSKAIENITREVSSLMNCEEENIVKRVKCLGLRELRAYGMSSFAEVAVSNIQGKAVDIIINNLKNMVAEQKKLLSEEGKKAKCEKLPEYLATLDTIRGSIADCLNSGMSVMTQDAKQITKTIDAALKALTEATEVDIKALLDNFSKVVNLLNFGSIKDNTKDPESDEEPPVEEDPDSTNDLEDEKEMVSFPVTKPKDQKLVEKENEEAENGRFPNKGYDEDSESYSSEYESDEEQNKKNKQPEGILIPSAKTKQENGNGQQQPLNNNKQEKEDKAETLSKQEKLAINTSEEEKTQTI